MGFASHPTIVFMQLRLLWSINERLAGGAGAEIAWPAMTSVEDVLDIGLERAEKRESDD